MKTLNDQEFLFIKNHVINQVLTQRGGLHVMGPNDSVMERQITEQVEVVIAILKVYQELLANKPL